MTCYLLGMISYRTLLLGTSNTNFTKKGADQIQGALPSFFLPAFPVPGKLVGQLDPTERATRACVVPWR
jgi:hypothetical protein